jgi:CRISPR system Cascade subunit CasA
LAQLGEGLQYDFDHRVDEIFFESLFTSLDLDPEEARFGWERTLRALADEELRRAIGRCAFPAMRRYKAVSAADGVFASCLRRHFPDVAAVLEGASA